MSFQTYSGDMFLGNCSRTLNVFESPRKRSQETTYLNKNCVKMKLVEFHRTSITIISAYSARKTTKTSHTKAIQLMTL